MALDPTFLDLQNEVLTILHGYTTDLEELTYLTSAIGTTDLTLAVGDATQVTRGLIEIDSELLWVSKTDTANGLITVIPGGRGFRDSSVATHAQNALVINNPRYPRQTVKTVLQETLQAVYPDLFQVKLDETQTSVPVQVAYQAPADCDIILDLRWKNIGPTQLWVPINRYKLDTDADTSVFSSGKSVEIYDGMVPGRTIKNTYIAQPGNLANDTDTLSSTGLKDSVRDVLVYGACYRLVQSVEVSRLQIATVEQGERAQLTPPGSATQASKYFFGLYTQALQREASRLQKFYSNKTHLVR